MSRTKRQITLFLYIGSHPRQHRTQAGLRYENTAKIENMISRQECIDRILANKNTIVEDYDVRSLRLFGSVARNEQKESSDVDVFVEMEPDIFQIIGLKEFLENLLGCSVDVVRKHRNNNEFLLKQIEKDGIDIIREPANRFAYA